MFIHLLILYISIVYQKYIFVNRNIVNTIKNENFLLQLKIKYDIIKKNKKTRRNNMVISSKEFHQVLADYSNFIASGKIPEAAYLQFQNQQNQVADELGIAYENQIGLFEIFDYCEKNDIDNESVNLLFSALKYNNQNIKNLYGLK